MTSRACSDDVGVGDVLNFSVNGDTPTPDSHTVTQAEIDAGGVWLDLVLAPAPPAAPFVIAGLVYNRTDGSKCNNPDVRITNLATGDTWNAENSSNYYLLVLTSYDVSAGDLLRFAVACPGGSQMNVTEHVITQDEVNTGGFKYDVFRRGDVNGDGRIDSADSVIALKMAACGDYDRIADVSNDGSVTSLDALMILQLAGE